MPPHDDRELTAREVQLIGDILVPRLKEELRVDFHKVRNDFTRAMADMRVDLDERLDAIEVRVGNLEKMRSRVALMYGVIVAFVTLGYHFAKDLIIGKWTR